MADAVDKSTVHGFLLNNGVNAVIDAITSQAALIKTLQDTLTALTGVTLPALDTKYLSKLKADVTPYTLTTAQATAKENVVRYQDVFQGILEPKRYFKNVGATSTSATLLPGTTAAITDPTSTGMQLEITRVTLRMITAPLVASTITIYANGTSIYTYSMALASLPVVKGLVDLMAGQVFPTNLAAGTVFTMTASAGVWDATISTSFHP